MLTVQRPVVRADPQVLANVPRRFRALCGRGDWSVRQVDRSAPRPVPGGLGEAIIGPVNHVDISAPKHVPVDLGEAVSGPGVRRMASSARYSRIERISGLFSLLGKKQPMHFV